MSSSGGIPSLKPVESRRTFEEILHQLEVAIVAGDLSAGDRLPTERELATRFEVSRTSVREALRVLEALGLVRVRRGAEHGVTLLEEPGNAFTDLLRFHVALRHLSVGALIDFRVVIESWAAGCAARAPKRGLLEALTEPVAQMESGQPGPDEFHTLDVDFHMALVRAAENELATLILEASRTSIDRIIFEALSDEPDWDPLRVQLTQEHHAILDAIEQGDPDRSAQLVADHIRNFWDARARRGSDA